jgi:hypothetical protein
MGDQDSECCAETIRVTRSTITGNATGWVIHNADVGFMSAVGQSPLILKVARCPLIPRWRPERRAALNDALTAAKRKVAAPAQREAVARGDLAKGSSHRFWAASHKPCHGDYVLDTYIRGV